MTGVKLDFPKPQSTSLPFAPLLEAILEMRWELRQDQNGRRLIDPSYPVMYGRLYDRLKDEMPLLEDLPANQANPEATPYVVRHRMRPEPGKYPLVQIGPGIVTINCAKDYDWDAFKALSVRVISTIGEVFPIDRFPLNWMKAELRYMNAVRFDPKMENPLSFLQNKLHIRLGVEEDLFVATGAEESPAAANFHLIYPLPKPAGHLILAGALGEIEGKTAYLLQTIVDSLGEAAPHDRDAVDTWLDDAHLVAKKSFQTLCKGELMKRFQGV